MEKKSVELGKFMAGFYKPGYLRCLMLGNEKGTKCLAADTNIQSIKPWGIQLKQIVLFVIAH